MVMKLFVDVDQSCKIEKPIITRSIVCRDFIIVNLHASDFYLS